MHIILGLLILAYIGALSFSLLPFRFFKKDQDPQEKVNGELPSIASSTLLFAYEGASDKKDETPFSDLQSIATLNYRGEWKAPSNSHLIYYFTQNSGFAVLSGDVKNAKNSDDYFELWLYDGKYINNRGIKIVFTYNKLTDYNPNNSTLRSKYIEFQLTLLNNLVEKTEKICSGSYQLSFIDSITQKPYTKSSEASEDIITYVSIHSPSCSISFSAETSSIDETFESNIMDYSIMMTLLCVCHLYACIHMIRSINHNESSGEGYSLISLAFLTAWDIFLCFFHLYDAIHLDRRMFHYFITPAFWYFVLAAIFETRLLTIIWKAKYYRSFETMSELRRGYGIFSIQVYGFLCLIIALAYLYLADQWLLYLTSLFFVPQIIHNALQGKRPKFDIFYIFFLGIVRTILPLYARGCPISIFKLAPSNAFIMNYSGIILFQVVMIYLQTKLGPRFFVPSYFLPAKYNYYLKMNDELLGKEEPCSICMDNLNQSPSGIHTPMLKIDVGSVIQVMKTPCKHTFHEKCLKDWMEIKLECPYCRANLPSLH